MRSPRGGSAEHYQEEAQVQACRLLPALRAEILSWPLSLGGQGCQRRVRVGTQGKGGDLPKAFGVPGPCNQQT